MIAAAEVLPEMRSAAPPPMGDAHDPAAPLPAGHGLAIVEHAEGRSRVIRAQARSPMKLLQPRDDARAARLVTSSFGGGLVAGDELMLRLDVGAGATAILGTQSSTKVFRSDGRMARQGVDATVGADALLAIVPDPVTCFAGARFEQQQRYDLAADASLMLVDLLTSGRWACGERWAFATYRSNIDVDIDGRPALRERVLLDPADGPIDSPYRCGRFECLATVLLIGPKLADVAQSVRQTVERHAVGRRETLIASASPLAGGTLLRVAGPAAEVCVAYVRHLCRGAIDVIGTDPWGRKW